MYPENESRSFPGHFQKSIVITTEKRKDNHYFCEDLPYTMYVIHVYVVIKDCHLKDLNVNKRFRLKPTPTFAYNNKYGRLKKKNSFLTAV